MERFFSSVELRAFRMAEIATGDAEEALDIVQDAMLALVRRYRSRPEQEWRPLFFKILQNRIRDWSRRGVVRRRWRVWLKGLRRDGREEREDPVALLADPAGKAPPERAAASKAGSAIEAALRDLPLRQQQVFLLRAWEGMSVREAARAMGCGEGTVKTLYSRATGTLRERLSEYRP